MRTRRLVEAAVVAALYAAMTLAVAPASYGPIQFRFAEILKPLVLWEPHLIPGFALGVFLANLASPYAGPWELVWMPAWNLMGGAVAWVLADYGRIAAARWAPVPGAARLERGGEYAGAFYYAAMVAAAVTAMLSVLLRLPTNALFFPLLTSEAVLMLAGVPLMRTVRRAVRRP